jgi:hypothetical protein
MFVQHYDMRRVTQVGITLPLSDVLIRMLHNIVILSLSLCLWLYSPLELGSFFNFLILYTIVELLGRGISPLQSRYLHTKQHKHRINAYKHPCLVWDWNPRFQCSIGDDGSCCRPRDHCDWHILVLTNNKKARFRKVSSLRNSCIEF